MYLYKFIMFAVVVGTRLDVGKISVVPRFPVYINQVKKHHRPGFDYSEMDAANKSIH